MGHKLDKLTTAASVALVLAALLACKKKKAPPPAASASAAAVASAAPAPSASAAPAPADTVTRYGDKETTASGTVQVTVADSKVYKAADATTDPVTTLAKGTYVNKKAAYGTWYLVDYPSGVGELSPGWILARDVTTHVVTATPAELKAQQEAAAKKAAEEAAAKKAADEKAAAAASASAQKAAAAAKLAAAKAAASAKASKITVTMPKNLGGIRFKAAPAKKK